MCVWDTKFIQFTARLLSYSKPKIAAVPETNDDDDEQQIPNTASTQNIYFELEK